jgi:hypothetical protein
MLQSRGLTLAKLLGPRRDGAAMHGSRLQRTVAVLTLDGIQSNRR